MIFFQVQTLYINAVYGICKYGLSEMANENEDLKPLYVSFTLPCNNIIESQFLQVFNNYVKPTHNAN